MGVGVEGWWWGRGGLHFFANKSGMSFRPLTTAACLPRPLVSRCSSVWTWTLLCPFRICANSLTGPLISAHFPRVRIALASGHRLSAGDQWDINPQRPLEVCTHTRPHKPACTRVCALASVLTRTFACPKPPGETIFNRSEWDSCPSAHKCCFCPLASLLRRRRQSFPFRHFQ